MKIIAHRGASSIAPENTLAALQSAKDLGVKWVEVDVQCTSDGVLVLVHDDTWMRTAGVESAIADLSWASARSLDVGAWFAAGFKGVPPPSLEAALRLTVEGLSLNLEIKSPHRHQDLGRAIAECVRELGLEDRVVLTCFDHEVIRQLAVRFPKQRLGFLNEAGPPSPVRGVGYYSLGFDYLLSHPQSIQQAHDDGVEVWAWTVDAPEIGERLAMFKVDGLITNHPERFLDVANRDSSLPSR